VRQRAGQRQAERPQAAKKGRSYKRVPLQLDLNPRGANPPPPKLDPILDNSLNSLHTGSGTLTSAKSGTVTQMEVLSNTRTLSNT
jgi:hypothetical protein